MKNSWSMMCFIISSSIGFFSFLFYLWWLSVRPYECSHLAEMGSTVSMYTCIGDVVTLTLACTALMIAISGIIVFYVFDKEADANDNDTKERI